MIKHEKMFLYLLELLAKHDKELCMFMLRSTSFTSYYNLNEMIKMISHNIFKVLSKNVNKSEIFVSMVGGTKDSIDKDQESICISHVDAMLNVYEELMSVCKIKWSMTSTYRSKLCLIPRFKLNFC